MIAVRPFFTDEFALAPARAPGWGPPGPPPDAWKARRPWQGDDALSKKRGTLWRLWVVSDRFLDRFLDSFGWT